MVAMLILSAWNSYAQEIDTLKTKQEDKELKEKAKQKKADAEQEEEEYVFDENAPVLDANATPRLYVIRKVNIHGVKHQNKDLLRSTSGLIPGDTIYLPSTYISNSISRLWAQRYFSDVKIGATIDGDSVDMEIFLKERPRVFRWDFSGEGITTSKKKDLLEELKLKQGS